MAQIRIRPMNGHEAQTLSAFDGQVAFLQKHGLQMERWPIESLDADKSRGEHGSAYILETFQAQIERLKAEKGYAEADVIALYPDTPNLDAILGKFDKEHYHTDDEVRFVVDGRGVFTIHSQVDDAVFDVEVHPGDLLVVPDGTWHWFELCEDKTIKCIRLFRDTSGWAPHYIHPQA